MVRTRSGHTVLAAVLGADVEEAGQHGAADVRPEEADEEGIEIAEVRGQGEGVR